MLGARLLQVAWGQEVLRNILRTGVCCSRRGLEVYYRFPTCEMSGFSFILLLSLSSCRSRQRA